MSVSLARDGSARLSVAAKLGLLGSLYLSQGLPFGFFTQALPVLLREQGVSLPAIGWTSLLALPWGLKALWAPIVDSGPPGALARLGLRRGFIIPLQLGAVLLLVAVAAIDPAAGLGLVLVAVFLTNLLAATQDIATDGLAVDVLAPHERGLGNGVQVAGYRVGMIVGGGVLLVALADVGWTMTFLAMAGVLALATLPIALFREGRMPRRATPASGPAAWLRALRVAALRPGMPLWLLLLVAYKAPDAFTTGMVRPYLVDAGFSMADVGWIVGTVGFTTSLVGALLGGALIKPLGRIRAVLIFGAAQILASVVYVPLALSATPSWTGAILVVGVEHLVSGMATVALFTAMMDACRPDHAATDYTLQASVVVLATGLGVAFSGYSAEAFGHGGHFVLGAALSAALLVAFARGVRSVHPRTLAGSEPTSINPS